MKLLNEELDESEEEEEEAYWMNSNEGEEMESV
jgi:hypothetical protein